MLRDKSIDALKGLAITLVVAGHAIPYSVAAFGAGEGLVKVDPVWIPLATATNPVFNLLGAFHMPLFAFISGMVLWPSRRRPFRPELLRRFKGLMIPYFAWFLVTYLISGSWMRTWFMDLGRGSLDALLGRTGLWYLYALFVCAVALACISRLPFDRWLLAGSALLAVVLSTEVLFKLPNVMFLDEVVWIYPFFVLGHLLGPLKPAFSNHRTTLGVGSLIVFVPLYYMLYPVLVPELRPDFDPIAIALHDAGIPGGYALNVLHVYLLPYLTGAAAVILLFAAYQRRTGWAFDAQAWLGCRSLGIFAVHSTLLWWMIGVGISNALVLFMASLAASAAVVAALERVPILRRVLLGHLREGSPGAPMSSDPQDTETGSSMAA